MAVPMRLHIFRIVAGHDGPIHVDEIHQILDYQYGISTTRRTVLSRLYELEISDDPVMRICKVQRGIYRRADEQTTSTQRRGP